MISTVKNFSQYLSTELPDLLSHQRESFERIRRDHLRKVFAEHFPVKDYSEKELTLEFVDYYFGKPKNTEEEARRIGTNYEAPLRVKFRLHNLVRKETEEQEIYFGDFPLMSERGSFIINGNERLVISQMVRSPGVYFSYLPFGERKLFGAKLIPQRGSWLEFQVEPTNVLQVRVDRKKKVLATVLLKALGITAAELDAFAQATDSGERGIIANTLKRDETADQEEALLELHHKLRPFEPNTIDNARLLFDNMFLREERYSLSDVGRYKLNARLNRAATVMSLEREDVLAIVREVLRLDSDPLAEATDIDSLENRRIRDIGELIENQARIGLVRMIKNIRDRMGSVDKAQTVLPAQVLYPRIFINTVKEFFNLSPLSQLLDQANILAELEHKRRFTAGGPGGLNKDRAGFEVRDLHPSHYGRVCPIQTPEGGSIGLVVYAALYARRNAFGFLETPYLKVEKGRVSEEIVYLDTIAEQKTIIGSVNVELDGRRVIVPREVEARVSGEPTMVRREELTHLEVSPYQILSAATAAVPFVEHNDANRAQMGANMQKQGVPLVRTEAPLVGTGIEEQIARSSGYLVLADGEGEVLESDADHVTVGYGRGRDGTERTTHQLRKYHRTNNFTSYNQKPVVTVGQKVKRGDVLADGPSADRGVMALGKNLLVAFISWYGYNFEDAIIVSERLLKDDTFTSLYLEEFTVDVRDTKLGREETTADIPNVPEVKLRNLDVDGVIRAGAEVRPGDILTGKITPKKELDLTPEEKLLKAIFGEKVEDVKDSSLYLDPGKSGRVTKVKVLEREHGEVTEPGVLKRISVEIGKLRKLQIGDKLANRHGNKGVISIIVPEEDMPFLPDGRRIDVILNPLGVVSRMNIGQILEMHLGWAAGTLGYRAVVPPMSGMTDAEIGTELKRAGLPEDGKTVLFDGKTGETFVARAAVGMMYIMKLTHMVEDKIHTRSIGPYSLITQQPLGGKAQFGGQRLGEMEVWALEGYAAVNTLQEMLTIKSDDVRGRSETYTNIIKGEEIKTPSLPSAFNVLTKELQGLGLSIEINRTEEGLPGAGVPEEVPERVTPQQEQTQ